MVFIVTVFFYLYSYSNVWWVHFITVLLMNVSVINLFTSNKNVDIEFGAHDAFLE